MNNGEEFPPSHVPKSTITKFLSIFLVRLSATKRLYIFHNIQYKKNHGDAIINDSLKKENASVYKLHRKMLFTLKGYESSFTKKSHEMTCVT